MSLNMKLLLLVIAAAVLNGQDTLPPSSRKPKFVLASIRVGDKACAFPVTASQEHHAWVHPSDITAYDPTGLLCAVIERTKDGWALILPMFEITEDDSDATYKRLGYIRFTEIREAKPQQKGKPK